VEVWLHSFLTSALDEGELSASRPGSFSPRERAPETNWIVGWVGPRVDLDAGSRTSDHPAPAVTRTPRSSSP
jgi:hypothetical protein